MCSVRVDLREFTRVWATILNVNYDTEGAEKTGEE